jgi:hypothetical protein
MGRALVSLLVLLTPFFAQAQSPSPPGARVFIMEPADGATVTSPVRVVFGAEGVKIIPSGLTLPGAGHHHLFVNVVFDDGYKGWAIPMNNQHKHYSGGQTEAELWLTPGTHTLQLVLGDGDHVPHEPPVVSDVVTITVTE